MSAGDRLRRLWSGSLRPICLVAVAAAILRALLFAGVELHEDEAYYWLWSRRPALGYFDHAPMVAWLIWVSSGLLPGELGVRIAFVASSGLVVVLTALIARELSDAREVPVLAALLAAGAPLLILTGGLALPDTPVTAAYAALCWLACRARRARWLLVGAAWGLALLSKYTAYLLLPGLVVLVAWDREFRAELRTRWPWLAGAVTLLVFLPNLWWNANHDFITFAQGFTRGVVGHVVLNRLLQFAGSLMVGAGPVVAVLGVGFLVRSAGTAARRVAAATLVPLAVFASTAIFSTVEPNWLAFLYPGLCAASAAGLARIARPWRTRLVAASLGLSCVLTSVTAAELRSPWLFLPSQPPHKRIHGGRQLAARVQEALGGEAAPFVIPSRYQLAAYLAYYGGWQRFGPSYRRPSQLDIWNDRPRLDEPVVVVANGEVDPATAQRLGLVGRTLDTVVEIEWHGQVLYRVNVARFAGQREVTAREAPAFRRNRARP